MKALIAIPTARMPQLIQWDANAPAKPGDSGLAASTITPMQTANVVAAARIFPSPSGLKHKSPRPAAIGRSMSERTRLTVIC
jgi:hypothetical protein